MRTSRLSRDTSKILSSARVQPTRNTRSAAAAIRGFALNGVKEEERGSDDGGSESELSSVPEDGDGDGDGEELKENVVTKRRTTAKVSVGKRKRSSTGVAEKTVVKKETKTEEISINPDTVPTTPNVPPKRARRAPSKQSNPPNGPKVKVEPPPHWEEIYTLTRQMRSTRLAPVDTMGCERLAEPSASPRDQRFQTLISLMLSSQTKDAVTSAAIKGMQEHMPGGFNLESVLKLSDAELNAYISKVGFHNLKTKYIKKTALILRDEYGGDIPDSIPGLTSLPGVGPKMAYLCLSAAWGRTEGIGVDVHVHRIANLWGWCKTKNPEETRRALESWLPKSRWHEINGLLVGFGQTVCLPVGRRCGECRLAERGLCPGAVVGRTVVGRKQEVVKEEGEGERSVYWGTKEVKEEEIKAEDVGEVLGVKIDDPKHDYKIKAEEVGEQRVMDIEDIGKVIGQSPIR